MSYELLLTLHVLAAVLWIGGAFTIQVLSSRALAGGDSRRMADLLDTSALIGNRVFAPSSLVLILAGFGLVSKLDLSLGEFWISWAFGVWILSFLAGIAYFGPESGRLAKLVGEDGPGSVFRQRLGRLLWVSRVELVLLISALVMMTAKPG